MKNGKEKPRATIRDLADHVGLSPTTISVVLGNRHEELRISNETVARVRDAAKKLGYVPNIAARRLRAHKAERQQVVLAVITSFEAPIALVSKSLLALKKVVDTRKDEKTSFAVAVEMFHAGNLKELPGLLDMSRFNGAIISNTVPEDDKFLASAYIPYPVVLIGREIAGYSSVGERYEEVAAQALDVLRSIGRKSLSVLHPCMLTQTTAGRLNAFVDAAGKVADAALEKIESGDLSEAAGYDAMAQFLKGGGKTDALFTVTDALAVGACSAIKRAGLKIPEDVAVIGVGDDEASRFLAPPLTSIGVSQISLNEEATKLLLREVDGTLKEPVSMVMPFDAVLRESTGHKS